MDWVFLMQITLALLGFYTASHVIIVLPIATALALASQEKKWRFFFVVFFGSYLGLGFLFVKQNPS